MEKSVNKVELKGNVGQDPKFTTMKNGAVVARFTLATSETFKKKDNTFGEETTWHNIVAWSKNGTDIFKDIKKGVFIEIYGKIRYVRYKDENDISKVFPEILAYNLVVPLARSVI